MHVGDPGGLAMHQKLAAGDPSFAENSAGEFASTGTDETVEAQDFATMEGERDVAVTERSCKVSRLQHNLAPIDLSLAQSCDAFLAADHERDQLLASHR